MCLTGAVCCHRAGSFHCLLGATESVFIRQVSWKMPSLRAKTWTKSGRGQVNLEISNTRWAECESAQGGGEEAPACGWRSLRLLWRGEGEVVNSWQGQGEVQKKGVLSPDYENSIQFPSAYFYWDKPKIISHTFFQSVGNIHYIRLIII